jgi:cytochrome c peroxidase
LGNPIKRTCSTCHNAQMTGMDIAAGWMDIGTNNRPYANPAPDLPLFKITCHRSAPPHPYLGRVIYTHDPGRALISGLCIDVGSITLQQLRGLAARAPYFADGSAKDLAAVVDYYDRRYAIHLSPTEKQDLINLMKVL